MKRFRLAFIGAGNRANLVHYPSFADLDNVEIVGVCDIDAQRLKNTCDKYHVPQDRRWTGGVLVYREMLDEVEPDGVAVIGQPHIMFDIWVYVLEHGYNLYIEKPMGITIHQARLLNMLAEKHNAVATVAFQRRITPVVMQLREKCLTHGPITHSLVRFYKCEPKPFICARDHMMDDCVHSIDTLRWVFDDRKIERVSSICQSIGTPDVNYISATLEFEDGGKGYLINSWTSGRRIFDMEMHAPGICAEVEHEKGGRYFENGDTEGVPITAVDAAGSDAFHVYTGVENLARDFVACCQDRNRRPASGFSNAIQTMEAAEIILAQALRRRNQEEGVCC